MNNDDGALSFRAVLDNKEMMENIRKSKSEVQKWGNDIVTETEKADKSFGKVGKNKDLAENIRKSKSEVKQWSGEIVAETEKVDKSFGKVGKAVVGYLSFRALEGVVRSVVAVRNEFQQLEIAFTTMLRSKEKADALVAEIANIAATTPFGLKDVASGTKMLLAYGSQVENIRNEITMLGDIASGVGAPLNDIIYLYGTLRTQGRAYAVDIRQFAGRGIPIYAELAKVLGTTSDQVSKFVEEGKVGFKEVEQAFKNMTSTGGQFSGLMEAQSRSIGGNLERLGDAFDMMLNKIGQANEDTINSAIKSIAVLIENYETVGKVIAGLVTTYGAYKAAVMIAHTVNNAVTVGSLGANSANEQAVRLANARAAQAEALAINEVIVAKHAEAVAILRGEQAKLKELATTEFIAISEAKAATSKVLHIEAQMAQVAASDMINKKRKLEVLQQDLLIAKEAEAIAIKRVETATRAVNHQSLQVETASKTANTLATQVNTSANRASIVTMEIETLSNVKLTAAQRLREFWTKRVAAAQAFLNATMLSNPYVAVTVGIVALGAALWALHDGTTAQEKAQKRLNELDEERKKNLDELNASISNYLSIIQDSNTTEFQKVTAYRELGILIPDLTKKYSLMALQALGAEKAAKLLNQTMDEQGGTALDSSIENTTKKIAELKAEYERALQSLGKGRETSDNTARLKYLAKEIEASEQVLQNLTKQREQRELDARQAQINSMTEAERLEYYKKQLSELEKQKTQLEKSGAAMPALVKHAQDFHFWLSRDHLTHTLNQIAEVSGKIAELSKGTPTNKTSLENTRKGLTEQLEALTPQQAKGAEGEKLKKQIRDIDKEMQAYSTTLKNASKAAKEEIFPTGSLAYYDKLIQKLTEKLSKTPVSNIGAVTELQKRIEEATRERAEVAKIIEVSTFEETLELKRQTYEEFNEELLAISTGNEPLLASKYSKLLEGGKSYVEFLNRELDKLKSSVEGDIVPDDVRDKIILLERELYKETDGRTFIELFEDSLDRLKQKSPDMYEYLRNLKQQLAELNENSPTFSDEKKVLEDEIKGITNQLKADLSQFLTQYRGTEEKRLAIIKHYAALRKQAQESGRSTFEIDKQEAEELLEVTLEANQEYQALLDKVYPIRNRKAMAERLKDLEKQRDILKESGATQKQLNQIDAEILASKTELEDYDIDKWTTWLEILGRAGDSLSESEGTLGAIGSLLSGMGSQASELRNTFQQINSGNMDTGSAIVQGVQTLAMFIEGIVSAAKKRKEAAKDFQNELLSLQLTYNQAINEEIRLRTILNENIFFKNYSGRITDAVDSMAMAVGRYREALMKLAEVEVKVDVGRKIDWGKVGGNALAGLSSGAAIGAAVGGGIFSIPAAVIGGAVGLIGGAVAGLLSQKTKDIFASLLDAYPDLIDAQGRLNMALAETLSTSSLLTDEAKEWVKELMNAEEALSAGREQITEIVSELVGEMGNSLHDVLVEAFTAGEDAAGKFAGTVEKTLNNILSNLIFSAVFTKAFDRLQEDLENAFGADGTGMDFNEMMKAMDVFLSQQYMLTDAFNKSLEVLKERGKFYGLNLFGNEEGREVGNNSISGIARGITEETGNALVGQLNAVRVHNADMVRTLDRMYLVQSDYLPFLQRLESIDRKLGSTSSFDSRSAGGI